MAAISSFQVISDFLIRNYKNNFLGQVKFKRNQNQSLLRAP